MTVDELNIEDLVEGYWKQSCGDGELLDRILKVWKCSGDVANDALLLAKVIPFAGSRAPPIPSSVLVGCMNEWTGVLRPFFEESNRETLPPTILARRQLDQPDNTSECLAIWDNKCTWRKDPRIPQSILFFINSLDEDALTRHEGAAKLIPFVLHLAEDYEVENRLTGVRCIQNYIRVVSDKIITQMRLDALFHQVLMKNFALDSIELRKVTLDCLLNSLYSLQSIDFNQRIGWLEELLMLLLKESAYARDINVVGTYLASLPKALHLLGPATICHVTTILGLLMDCKEYPQLSCLIPIVLMTLFDVAWPRLGKHSSMISEIIISLKRYNIPTKDIELRLEILQQ